MVRDSNETIAAKLAPYQAVGLDDHHLTIAAIKMIADGALGSRGAWMLEPYSDLAVEHRPPPTARKRRADGAARRRTASSWPRTPSAIAPTAKC